MTGGPRVAEPRDLPDGGGADGSVGSGRYVTDGNGRYFIDESDPERKRRIYVSGPPRYAEDRPGGGSGGSAAGGPFAWQGAVGDPVQWSQGDAPSWVRGFQPGGPGPGADGGAPPSVVSLQSALRAGRINMDGPGSIDGEGTNGLAASGHGFTGEGGGADGRDSVFGGFNPLLAGMRSKDKDKDKDKDSKGPPLVTAHGHIAEAENEDDGDESDDDGNESDESHDASEGDADDGSAADAGADDDVDDAHSAASAHWQQPHAATAGRVLSAAALGVAVSTATAAPAPPRPVPSAPPRAAPAPAAAGSSTTAGRVAQAPTPARRK